MTLKSIKVIIWWDVIFNKFDFESNSSRVKVNDVNNEIIVDEEKAPEDGCKFNSHKIHICNNSHSNYYNYLSNLNLKRRNITTQGGRELHLWGMA